MLATSVQPLLSKLLTCSGCSCIVYCRGTFSTIVSVGEQEKKPKLKAGAFRCWSHQESLSLSCPEPSWTKGGATIATMATRQKLCSWHHNPQMQSRHFARTFEKTATQGDVTGWNLKEFRKNLGAALIATVSNKFSLRGERSEPGELFLPCGFSCVSGPDVAKFETTSAMGSKP